MMFSRVFLYIAIVITALHTSSQVVVASYRGFREVEDDKCVALQDKDLMALPANWQRYRGFVKRCELRKDIASKAMVSLISVWSHDYLDAQNKKSWEAFPLPILVDSRFRQFGTLPELYPASYVNSVYVSYGRWRSGIPTEIRVDVADPTVSGDYHYAPLLWDDREKKYRITNSERISGRRHHSR